MPEIIIGEGAESPAPPEPPAEPLAPGSETPQPDLHREAELLQRARHFAGNRELHESEHEAVLLMARAENSLTEIETATREMMERNFTELPRNLSERIRQIVAKVDRARIGLMLGTLIASPLVRAGFKSITATNPVAGILTGTLIGGTFGAIRGYFTEKKKQYSPESIKAEYDQIQNESGTTHALAFLHTMLSNGDLRHTDYSGRLQLMALFLSEAKSATAIDAREETAEGSENGHPTQNDEAVAEILTDTLGMRNNYHSTAKSACVRAMWPAAKKGMLWGAGFGAISDVVSWFTASARAGHAVIEHRESVFSQDNAFRGEFHDKPLPLGDNFYLASLNESGLRETDFGNTLSRAISEGINAGKLHLPDPAYLVSSGTELARLPNDAAVNYATEFFKYAQPLPEHEYFYHGQDVAYNWEAIQKFLDFTYANGASPERMTDALMSADSIINATQEQMLTEGARQAAEVATREGWGEGLAHGVGIAAGASLGSRRSTPEPKQGGINLGGGTDGSGEASGGGETTSVRRRGDGEGRIQPPADTEEGEGGASATKRIESRIDTSFWSGLFNGDQDQFTETANHIVDDTAKGWDDLEDQDKERFISLCTFAQSTQGTSNKVLFTNEGTNTDYTITSPPTNNNPTLELAEQDGSALTIDLRETQMPPLNRLTIKIT